MVVCIQNMSSNESGTFFMASVISLGRPNPKQARFFESRARYIGYGGARGGGKSWAMRTKLVLLALRYPGLNLLLLRRTLPELRENHLMPLQKLLCGTAAYGSGARAFQFANGSRIRLGYCDSEADVFQYQGQEYDVIGVEECTHFTWTQVQFLMTCNRSVRPDFNARMYFTGNPGGVGHAWFRRLFVKKQFMETEKSEDYEFIPATVDDNEFLLNYDPGYVAVLDALPEKLRRAHRYGDWDVFEGQFFSEFIDAPSHYQDRQWTHVIEPFSPPSAWPVYRSFDFGYARPFSCGWWAVDYDGRLYRILELYGCTDSPNTGLKWPPEKIFAEIARMEREHPYLKGKRIFGVADPSIWDASRGVSIEETAAGSGVYFDKGDNARIPGWMQMHYRLAFDENGIPMLYCFSNCAGFVRTLPTLVFSKTNPEDLDTTGEDHIADETRYLCMARPIAPRCNAPRKTALCTALDL